MHEIAAFLAAATMSVMGSGGNPAPTTTSAIAPAPPCAVIARAPAFGSRGADVAQLQSALGVEATGYFGPLTRAAVVKWQIAQGIVASAHADGAGIVGPRTRASLACAAVASATTTTTTATSGALVAPPAVPSAEPTPQRQSGSIMVPPVSPYGYTCHAPSATPPAGECATGSWELSADEAGCIVWACINDDIRG